VQTLLFIAVSLVIATELSKDGVRTALFTGPFLITAAEADLGLVPDILTWPDAAEGSLFLSFSKSETLGAIEITLSALGVDESVEAGARVDSGTASLFQT
jgi:hypothetical protein